MRLCKALVHYFLFLFLSLSVFQCYGHEHHTHVDSVTTKYSQPAANIDPINNNIETTNVHKHTDEDHHHDTIDARLRAKHSLRQSVHQHTDDDKHENEEDYINRLNSALEDNYKHEHQFQYAVPPVVDLVNNTQLENQTSEDIQKPLQTHNDTTSPSSTSTPTPLEQKQHTTDTLPPIDESKIIVNQKLDEILDSKVPLDQAIPSLQVDTNEQKSTDTRQENIVKEDVLFIHTETLSTTLSSLQHDDTSKSTSTTISPIPVQEPPTTDTVRNDTPSNDSQLETKSSTPTQLQAEEVKSETTPNVNVSDTVVRDNTPQSDSMGQQVSDKIGNVSSTDENTTPITPIKLNEEQQKPDEAVRSTIEQLQKTPQSDETEKKSDESSAAHTEQPTIVQSSTPPTPPPSPPSSTTRVLRSSTARLGAKLQNRQRHAHGHGHIHGHDHGHDHSHSHQEPSKAKQEPEVETVTTTEKTTTEATVSSTATPIAEQPVETSASKHNLEPSEELSPAVHTDNETKEQLKEASEAQTTNDTDTQTNDTVDIQPNDESQVDNVTDIQDHDQVLESLNVDDLPRQVHVHDSKIIYKELKEELLKTDQLSHDQELESNNTASSFLANEHSPHLPRTLDNEELSTTTAKTIEATTERTPIHTHIDSNVDDVNNSSMLKSNYTDTLLPIEHRQVCWRLPKPFESSVVLVENQALRFTNLLPEYIQAIFLGPTVDRERLMNTVWFGSICSICFFLSFIFLSVGAKRLKQSKDIKEVRARCQQLQQYNNQLELERATFEKQNQKLSDEIDEMKTLPIRDADEEIFDLRDKYERLYAEFERIGSDYNLALKDIDYKQSLIQKHDFDMQKQAETAAHLNNEILRQKQELEKERETIARLQSNDLSLERFETLQQTILDQKAEISQLKQAKLAQIDELEIVQKQAKQLDLDNNQLTIKMKQLKDLLQQQEETINRINSKAYNGNDDDEKEYNNSENGNADDDYDEEKTRGKISKTKSLEQTSDESQRELLSKIDDDVEKANQHLRDLHCEIDEKTRRIKELDLLLNQERDRCRELETKLKVVLELRERDAHLHIRQLGQTDAELRKARNDTERVRILQQQLQLKEQQLEDVRKVLNTEQTKFTEECSKLQHEIHEKWMEVKRLTRELDGAKKECESLRRQISKYGNSDRSSLEKTMHKPVPQHMNTSAGRASSDPETNGSSPPPPIPYQQGDNFRPIDNERNDSGAASPSEMFRMRPPLFGLPRPPFYPPPFLPPPPNPFMMGARFPMPIGAPHGMISPIPHLITNGSGGSDANSFEIVDSTNITPNSISYDTQLNGSAVSPPPDGEQQATTKVKKPKKSLKKKSKTSSATVAPAAKEDV
ncbi:unnamed protein product [Adineta ricciae]|uniref:Transport and Golgi organization protein 1 n=1 Tax=Adineta ricciae TaxID=249248 RepID=A0A814WY62_ADIRI|nr:unnamed protein product [Adineta ricciae]